MLFQVPRGSRPRKLWASASLPSQESLNWPRNSTAQTHSLDQTEGGFNLPRWLCSQKRVFLVQSVQLRASRNLYLSSELHIWKQTIKDFLLPPMTSPLRTLQQWRQSDQAGELQSDQTPNNFTMPPEWRRLREEQPARWEGLVSTKESVSNSRRTKTPQVLRGC